jgi:Xaa-Pro aminopeptidase
MTAESDKRTSGRLEKARRLLAQEGLDVLLVTATPDVRYLSGFRGDDSALLIAADWALIATDSRYWAQVHEEVSAFALLQTDDLLEDALTAVRERAGGTAKLGFQGGDVSYGGYRRLRRLHQGRLRDVGGRVAALRLVKDEDEIAAVRRACVIADAALERVLAVGLVGRSERDVAWQIRAEMNALGAEGPSFDTIVATGERAALAHAIPGERRIAAGELVVIDTGARVDGYCSDITRTFAAGAVADDQRAVYEIVRQAQLAGLAAVGDGGNGRSVDGAARAVIEAAGYGDHFGHGTGHGVGLEIHEGPRLGRRRGDPLASGMVVTVEPGIYLEGRLGVRIEDTVLVTATGGETLTAFAKELLVTN